MLKYAVAAAFTQLHCKKREGNFPTEINGMPN